ncbi:MAG TPA: EamA family transporter [Gammaproteobacteria bacterium]|nr:EamA family transporter [Gammaproteobacteria bacterium]
MSRNAEPLRDEPGTPSENFAAARWKFAAAFAVVYVVWGSTYLFIRIGVADIAPTVLAGLRFTAAGLALTAIGFARGEKPPRGRDWSTLAVLAVGLVVIGNGVVTWAEQWVPSGEAAFIVASSALFTVLFGTLGPRGERLTLLVVAGLALGFLGTALMLWPRIEGLRGPLWPALALVGSSCSWAAASMYARGVGVHTTAFMFSGLQMLAGGLILIAIALASGGFARTHWSPSGIAALAYLAVFGSAIAYLAYNWLIQHARPAQLGTTAYVNPAVALLLGWAVLGEVLPPIAFAGVGVMFVGVVLLTLRHRARVRPLVKPRTGA